jgi:hypothetical protein
MRASSSDGENHEPRARWNAVAAIVASLIGLMALLVSGYTAYVQRQQVRAQVWPFLIVGNYDPEYAIKVLNKGVGPAIVRSVQFWVDDKPQPDWKHVLTALDTSTKDNLISTLSGNVLSPGETVTAIKMSDSDVYHRVRDAMRSRAAMEICFCSTLDECWLYSDRVRGERPTQRFVESCPAVPKDQAFND